VSGTSSIEELFAQGGELQQQGRAADAGALYEEILGIDPGHAPTLSRLSRMAVAGGQFDRAEELLRQALTRVPDDVDLRMNLGAVLHAAGKSEEAVRELETACRLDPEHDAGWLYLGASRMAAGDLPGAVRAFQVALMVNPDLEQAAHMPRHSAQALAASAVQATQAQYKLLQNQLMDELQSRFGAKAMDRVRRCLAIQHGKEQVPWAHPLQQPAMLYMPEVPPRPWFERDEFDWVERVEAATDAMRDEVLALRESSQGFTPYVAHGEVAPEPMRHLAGSFDWHAFHLYASGERKDENCARCPVAMELVQSLPLVKCHGTSPEAFFSLLQPGTHIKPHFGVANTKVAVHLPLVIPRGDCAIRVGEETRHWTEGRCLIFDDSFEHEAWNRSDELRVVFIFEVWNPCLTTEECTAIEMLCAVSATWVDGVMTEETGRM